MPPLILLNWFKSAVTFGDAGELIDVFLKMRTIVQKISCKSAKRLALTFKLSLGILQICGYLLVIGILSCKQPFFYFYDGFLETKTYVL
ncbi:hypothetical protein L596_023742 [Steinernema carpocapsae]|uniref:Uncharacterized protein n=1 Tax=Steinernema carpocapsae TaxID=34508 RepID=A0A4U5MEK8_STECR|nr:hypothetical protein L596_023742 [Steinernema carpocapsae]